MAADEKKENPVYQILRDLADKGDIRLSSIGGKKEIFFVKSEDAKILESIGLTISPMGDTVKKLVELDGRFDISQHTMTISQADIGKAIETAAPDHPHNYLLMQSIASHSENLPYNEKTQNEIEAALRGLEAPQGRYR